MTAKEKAVELYSKYEQLGRDFTRGVSMHEFAKQCVVICCDQVLSDMGADRGQAYWMEVKEQIEKL
jgi:predicted house-cleaning NTP pyrophosphatase (Maf/HAM1 superfamily)